MTPEEINDTLGDMDPDEQEDFMAGLSIEEQSDWRNWVVEMYREARIEFENELVEMAARSDDEPPF